MGQSAWPSGAKQYQHFLRAADAFAGAGQVEDDFQLVLAIQLVDAWQLLDQLDAMHKFDPPPTLVKDEFDRVWNQVTSEMATEKKSFADENTTEEKARDEYQKIAERRVRLGLVLAEIGEKNNITVTDEELNRALVEQARQFPGQEQQVWEYYRKNPQAVAGLRAPIYEEKVVDFLLELAKVTDKKVSREDLLKEDEPATP